MSTEQFSLKGRTVLVTGSSTGLGKRMALALGQAGALFAFKPHFGWVGAIEREPENQVKR